MRRVACMLLAWLGLASAGRAEPAECARPDGASVLLASDASVSAVALEEVTRHLAAGLSAAGVAVCTQAAAGVTPVAKVMLEQDTQPDGLLHIHTQDVLTNKVLERSIDLRAIPEDSRALATALYVEELLQASWAEITLQRRIYLQEHPVQTPPEVKRELASVMPEPEKERPRRLRVSLGGAFSRTQGGLWQAGPDAHLGFTTLPWLELSLRIGYRTGPSVETPRGWIRAQSILGSVFLEPFWQITDRLSLRFPQGIDVSNVMFSARPNERGQSASGNKPAVLINHAAGLRVVLSRFLSLTLLGRFVWTVLPAGAEDFEVALASVSGVGGEGALTLDTMF